MSSLSPFLEDAEAPLELWTPEPVTAQTMDTEGEDWEASEAPAGVEPWAETAPAVHPLTRVFPLPGAVLDALSGGLAPLAVGLAASAGYTDVNQLTNIVFYFRHPELIGRKIEPGQRALAEEWVSIRDRIVKPALRSVPSRPAPTASAPVAPRPGGTVARPASLSSGRLAWPGHSEAELAFMRAVYDRQAQRARGDFVVDLPETALDPIEGHKARKDAAAAMKALLDEARAALKDESPNKKIGIISAYRSASRQFAIWQGREPKGKDAGSGFPHYYRRAIREGVVGAGDYSADAADKVARFVGRFIASPGYSNHQDGLAFDLGTNDVGKKGLKKLYTGAWFHNWLRKNGKRLRFRPLADEPWHWTFEPSSGSELEAELELGEATTAGVRAGRLEVRSVPMLASHRGSPPDLILRWNQMAAVPETVDVVVHLHGFWYGGMRLPRDIEPVSGLDLAPIAGTTGAARTRPTLTVLPRGHDTGIRQKFKRKDGSIAYGYNAMTFPALVARNGLADLVRLSLERFAAAVGGPPPRVGRLILTAHSGGGQALLQLLEHHDPHQVHVFDALYWPPEPLERWARRRIERDGVELTSGGAAYMATRGGALRVFYQGRTTRGTTPSSRRLQAALAPLLEGELARWYRVEASAFDHFQIPRRYGWRVLADASADVPEARAAPLGGGRARELDELGGETSDDELEELEELEDIQEEQVEVDELGPPPLNALPEPVSRRSRREVLQSDSEATLWEAEEDAFDESAALGLFDEPESEDLFEEAEDGLIQLAPDAQEDEDEAAEALYEGVDLSGEEVEPEDTLEWDMEQPELHE